MAEGPPEQVPEPEVEKIWRAVLTKSTKWHRQRREFLLFPARRRCKNCLAPLSGIGVYFMRRMGRAPFTRNPRFCEF